ncbi:hypothetical protein GP486_006933 [Trichoglossum hirsutum]|uniref:Exocyst complex component SEC5 n=1 Tax=Trichoglossum hirsutum TaxID=265104 RepID=A0A9P8L764_9PEZI|nr:hypothetical protein GP486_006933 [Trichoglossum hirsutum]
MAELDRSVLRHYNLSTSCPTEWPTEKDHSDASDDESPLPRPSPGSSRPINPKDKALFDRSKTKRYSVLERNTRQRRFQEPELGVGGSGDRSAVQGDEPDPLGAPDSVVRILRQRGLPVDEDAQLRNRFLLSSPTFSPSLYLSKVHPNDSTQALLQGLEFLSRSIDQKSASLKMLVESNFERFVRAKSTIDGVYTEMRNQGTGPEKEKRLSQLGGRSSGQFAANNTPSSPGFGSNKPLPSVKKKNALTPENEYSVAGIKASLEEAVTRAEDVWGPALNGRERGESLKTVLSVVEKYRGVLEVGGQMADCIKRRDYETLVEEYTKARKYVDEVKLLYRNAQDTRIPLSDAQVHQIIITARMWADVGEQLETFKRETWKRLVGIQTNIRGTAGSSGQTEEYMELISILLELGVEDNPIWVWLLSRYDYLKNKIGSTAGRAKVDIEVHRRRLANGDKPSNHTVAFHLRSSIRRELQEKTRSLDTAEVIELWDRIYSSLNTMLALQGGLLGDVIDFWETAQAFIEGKTQKTLPVGIDGQSRKHHHLSADGTRDLQKGAIELVDLIRDNVFSLFAEPPIDNLPLLKSMQTDSDLPPLPLTSLGEAWEKFAFWPPYSNSLSGVHYLSKILILIGSAASEMGAMSPVGKGSSTVDKLRSLVGGARERAVQAICAAWNRDAENCKLLEDWTRAADKQDLTKMPSHFMAFESAILGGMQKILYISEAMTKPGSADVVTPPPAKLLQLVRSQFVTSLYKALSGMVENAERPIKGGEDGGLVDDGLASPITREKPSSMTAHSVNASDRNVRMLLTLSNLHFLRTDVVPNLTSQFENAFSVKLTDETQTIRDVLSQIDARLFQSFTKPTIASLSQIVSTGILSPSWAPAGGRPTEVRPYIYQALLVLVMAHTQISTTSPSLTPRILSHLLEQLSRELLDAFRQRPRYSLAALMQATLDVEFVAQSLAHYTTDLASDLQNQIYLELDRGTDNDARMRLQSELPEMRNILKLLRESTRAEL